MRLKVNAEEDAPKAQNCVTRAQRPYPNLLILPLHRLLQVRDFSNETFLLDTQLTDVLNSSRREARLRCRESRKETSSACMYSVERKRSIGAFLGDWRVKRRPFTFFPSAFWTNGRLHFCTFTRGDEYLHSAAPHFVLASLSFRWTGTEAQCGCVSLARIPVRNNRQIDNYLFSLETPNSYTPQSQTSQQCYRGRCGSHSPHWNIIQH